MRIARSAERGRFDFVLLDFVLDSAPDPFSVLAALPAVTDRIGLVAVVDTDTAEPFDVARKLATVDHLSGGRAGWRIADSCDRDRAEEFAAVAREFWDSWAEDAVTADRQAGRYVDPDRIRPVEHRGAHFTVRGVATMPRPPQRHPVLITAGLLELSGPPGEIAAEIARHIRDGGGGVLLLDPDDGQDGLDTIVEHLGQTAL
ncbi:hypothetical protein BST38_05555 [Mycolicibacterium parafortuitum]|nr:hypothetical protein BST38_05555 [Mycolicibacterium parafortuitum]